MFASLPVVGRVPDIVGVASMLGRFLDRPARRASIDLKNGIRLALRAAVFRRVAVKPEDVSRCSGSPKHRNIATGYHGGSADLAKKPLKVAALCSSQIGQHLILCDGDRRLCALEQGLALTG